MCLFEHSTNHVADSFRHVLGSMRHQVVVLYDLTSFKGGKKTEKQCQGCGVLILVIGYILYVLPICGLITLSLFGHTTSMVCKPLNATFLLNNDVVPVVNMSNLYRLRQVLEQKSKEFVGSAGGLVWDSGGYRRHNYWPIENITDLINQYNYIGLHDICIYPRELQDDYVSVKNSKKKSTKGLYALYHGYAVHNSSGADLKCCYFTELISYQIIFISVYT